MVRRRSLWGAAVAIALTIAAAGCATKTVNHILADPGRYRDRQVTLSGRVSDSYSIGNRGVYVLEDRTGSLVVVSDNGVPRRGAHVKVRGRVREAFNLGALGDRLPRSLAAGLVLVESSHRADN
jgi:hypothetical protein